MADPSGKESAVLPKLEQIWAHHLAGERIYWDQAKVLRQIGRLADLEPKKENFEGARSHE